LAQVELKFVFWHCLPLQRPLCKMALPMLFLGFMHVATVVGGLQSDGESWALDPPSDDMGIDGERLLQPVLAHYMPWFMFNASTHEAGWHWTMDYKNKTVDPFASPPRIAAHSTPLIGPYDSRDRRVIRYHLELMQKSGIQGVIVNWYGTRAHDDYPRNLEASDVIIDEAAKAGMMFSVAYEDWTVDDGSWEKEPKPDVLQAARAQLAKDFEYLRDRYMTKPGFLRIGGRPLLLVFGPRKLCLTDDWEPMLSSVFPEEATRPMVMKLQGNSADIPPGYNFPWFPSLHPPASSNASDMAQFLKRYYKTEAEANRTAMGVIWQGFHDYYKEGSGGVEKSYGYLDPLNGRTADLSMNYATKYKPAFVQLTTWNDWQEGTTFEPSREAGYFYLKKVQQHILGVTNETAFKEVTSRYFASIAKDDTKSQTSAKVIFV